MIHRIAILGTGLIGSSIGLALRSHGFAGSVIGWDPSPEQLGTALSRGAIHLSAEDPLTAATQADLILLAGPVFTIIEHLDRLAPVLRPHQLVTDTGSVKGAICNRARDQYNGPGRAGFLPGHPMAGKEVSGAANADPALFSGSAWIFTPDSPPAPPASEPRASGEAHEAGAAEGPASSAIASEWRSWVTQFGARIIELPAEQHDVLCAWISHLPQMVSTAMSALLEEEFASSPDLLSIGGRALREMTRLGASPFSMWRDIAHTNADAIGRSLHALEQRLAHIRENLKTPELREEFDRANRFRPRQPGS